jgi:hypothetical protein
MQLHRFPKHHTSKTKWNGTTAQRQRQPGRLFDKKRAESFGLSAFLSNFANNK